MSYITQYIGFVLLILSCMSIDNICWMTSSPEWEEKRKSYWSYFKFFIWRIWSVHKDYRDIIPALITALALTFIYNGLSGWGLIVIILAYAGLHKYFFLFGRSRSW